MVEIGLVGRADFGSRARIGADGTVLLPLVGAIRAANRTVTEHIRKVHGVASTRTLIAFRTYSRHDLDEMFSVGFESGQPD